jgi:hypothetical protein
MLELFKIIHKLIYCVNLQKKYMKFFIYSSKYQGTWFANEHFFCDRSTTKINIHPNVYEIYKIVVYCVHDIQYCNIIGKDVKLNDDAMQDCCR